MNLKARAGSQETEAHRSPAAASRRGPWRSRLAGLFVLLLLLSPASALANEYEESRSGHPMRVAAYVLHPVGVILDRMIFRPAHWIGTWGPLRTLFGHHEAD